MRSIKEIAAMPTTVDQIPVGSRGVHESCLRSYAILDQVKYLLREDTKPEIVLALIAQMEGKS